MGPIDSVTALDGYRLRVELKTGSSITVDLSKKLKTVRFAELADPVLFRDVTADSEAVTWGEDAIRVSLDELIELATCYWSVESVRPTLQGGSMMADKQLEAKVQKVTELLEEDEKFKADFVGISTQDELVKLVKSAGIEVTDEEAVEAYAMFEEQVGRELSDEELLAIAGGANTLTPPATTTVIHENCKDW